MINQIVALGYGIVVLAMVVGVGSLILYNFGVSSACGSNFPTWNTTALKCQNTTGGQVDGSVAYTNTNYLNTQLGSGGLAGWAPAIIAVSVGLLFLGYFAVGKGKKM
jgi:hypothetical protein